MGFAESGHFMDLIRAPIKTAKKGVIKLYDVTWDSLKSRGERQSHGFFCFKLGKAINVNDKRSLLLHDGQCRCN